MNGNQYVESTSRTEILDLLRRCGPLTIGQIDRIRRKTRSDFTVRWLQRNGYVGMLPTNPMQFVAGNKELDAPTVSDAMKQVLEALEKHGPCASWELGLKIGKSREHVDSYFRAARAAGLAHRAGELQSFDRNTAYTWAIGAGKDYVKPGNAETVKAPEPKRPVEEVLTIRRDPFISALFGERAAA